MIARALGLTALAAALVAGTVLALRPPYEEHRKGREDEGYLPSETCVSCHPDHHASWRRTHHGRMTQEARGQAVLAPFDGEPLSMAGLSGRMERQGDGFSMTFAFADGEKRTVPVVFTVGSRRIQQYVTKVGERHFRLPFAWDNVNRRVIHLNGSFFEPDGTDPLRHLSLWDANCVFCHNVKAQPGRDETTGGFATEVAELGISCGACHGRTGTHAARGLSPFTRSAWRLAPALARDAVDPSALSRERSVMVCAHCHGQRVPEPLERIREILARGDPFDAGEDLSAFYRPATPDLTLGDVAFAPRYWKDGSPRLTAHEYQGLLRSACWQKGTQEARLTCLTCHSMHGGDPNGMITEKNRTDAPCLGCHGRYAPPGALKAHTGHEPASAGSRCFGCHMPRVVYGVMAVHPTHDISVPDPRKTARDGSPNACSQCHLDKPLSWAVAESRRLWPERFGGATAPLEPSHTVPEGVRALFAGDAIARALAAEALGGGGPTAPDPAFSRPFLLAAFETDPYPIVRFFAAGALAKGAPDLPKPDYLAGPAARDASLGPWRELAGARGDGALVRARALAAELSRLRTELTVDVGE